MKSKRSKNPGRRKDHFVPETYLNGFTDHDRKFYLWEKNTKKPIDYKYPAQHCWLDHYYQIAPGTLKDKVSQIDPDFVERYAFKVFEDTIQDLVRMLELRPDYIPIDIFLMLCRGFILQKIRTPAYEKGVRKIHAEQGEQLVRGSIEKTRAKISRDDPRFALIKDKPGFNYYFTDEFWSKMVEEYKVKPIDTRSTQHLSIIETYSGMGETANLALGRLSMMHMTIYIAPDDAYFLTSDSPGYSLVPHETEAILKAVDFRFRDMLAILLPLSSKLAMFLHFYSEPNTEFADRHINYHQLSVEDVYLINKDTFDYADEKVFCVDKKYLQWFRDQVMEC